ncbi:uncharacterized protein LOC135837965 [Planococcus citri]|uniref:uncharacterized protein LOC135837965 n=1 Tax=Planococcus citri TaxID=170843 RepID=UPI0031F95B9C
MFVKLAFTFLTVFLLHGSDSQSTNTTNSTNGEPEKTVQIPRSLIEEMLKKEDDVEGIKELLRLLSTSNTTAVTLNSTAGTTLEPSTSSTTTPDSVIFPIRRLVTGIKKILFNLTKRIKEAKVLDANGTLNTKMKYRSRKVAKLVYILQGLKGDLDLVVTAGRDMKTIWVSMKEFLKEDIEY